MMARHDAVQSALILALVACFDRLHVNAFIQQGKSWHYSRHSTELQAVQTRRGFASLIALLPATVAATAASAASAEPAEQFDPNDPNNDPEIQEIYNNPNIPVEPEEKSGLVVLRVAEVAQFQEKILRAIVNGDLKDVTVSPMQFAFGTQILLRNSNLDGNMKLMINEEVPKKYRPMAVKNAVNAMNTLQEIGKYSASIQRDFEPLEMVTLADMYLQVRMDLNQLYEYLPQTEKDKYYGYFAAVTEYEKKVANGTYNPDIDGVLKFD